MIYAISHSKHDAEISAQVSNYDWPGVLRVEIIKGQSAANSALIAMSSDR